MIEIFDSVSVREQSSVNLCKEHFGIEAKCVLDSTLLVDREVYEDLCALIPKDEESIWVYVVDYSEAI